MNDQTDSQLLRTYAENRSEAAFTELARRHVDFVYSAARRMVWDPHLAEDVTQGVFVAFAKNARQLTDHSVLSGWLHHTAQNIAAQSMRTINRRRAREQEAATMNELIGSEADASWEQIAPELDAALSDLSEPDRNALFLRYFERKSAREMAQVLNVSEEAAQKRVNRAVERLREMFAKRGITVGASGLVVIISANAIQAAPAGLAITVSAAALVGSAVSTSTIIAASKTIVMTTLQKTLLTASVAALAGAGIYQNREASHLRDQVQTYQQQQAPLTEQIRQLQTGKSDASNRFTALQEENAQLKSNHNTTELLRLRGEVARLRGTSQELANLKAGGPTTSTGGNATGDASQLTQEAMQLWQTGRPAEAIPKFKAALKLDPANSTAWNGLGWASFNSGKKAASEKAFQKVIELVPDHPAALNGLGQIYFSEKKYPEAESYLLKASIKAPAAWYGLTKLYLLQDKFEQAEKWAQTIIDSGQGDEAVRAMLKAAKDRQVSDALRLMIEPQ